ncbi:ATP-dependent zinc metalloprotease FtsH [Candidatus Kuenenbacteria bacterium]|nr:ATP-dependent zinc metalloprotease FtsH [Candidatus Kuenenbacteria bacterium]
MGDSLVLTNKGLIEIKEIPKYFWVNPQTNEVKGALLPTLNLNSLKDKQKEASHWYDLGEQSTKKITLRQGMQLEGTPEHPVVIMNNNGELIFKPINQLIKGDLVAIKFNTQVFGYSTEVDVEQSYIMGLLTGDGNLSYSSRIGLTSIDNEIITAFKNYIQTRYSNVTINRGSDKITYIVNSWSVKRDLYKAGMSYLLSYDKTIPDSILQAPKEVVIAFLQGLFDTDGYFERYNFGYATVSKKLSNQVMALLLNLGIIPRRRIKTKINKHHSRPVYEITVSETSLIKFAQEISFRVTRKQSQLENYLKTHKIGNTNIDLFYNFTDKLENCWKVLSMSNKSNSSLASLIDKIRHRQRISRNSLKLFIEAFEKSGCSHPDFKFLKSFYESNLFFSTVTTIENGFNRVYDFTVPNFHSFISNGFISHNTLLARAVAGEANVPFFFISGSEFVEMFVGVGAARVRSLFKKAKKESPAIIFVDELDAVGRLRGAGLGGSHDEREQTLNQILVEMDGFEVNDNVIVVAATNRPDVLDPALLRPGRFDRRIILDLPDINDREQILKLHAQKKPLDAKINLKKVAEHTPGFSGADLFNLLNEAAILTARRNKKEITEKEILESIERVLLGPARKSHILSKKEKEITAYHEAGHALVAHELPLCAPVRKVSILSRGRAAGYTLKLPEEDKYLHSKSEMTSELACLLAGYVAEKEIFNEVTTGATNDLEHATRLAKKLVVEYGMSEILGPRTFGEREEMVFLGKQISEQRDFSEKTAQIIDQEVSQFIDQAHKIAIDIVKNKKNYLDKITKILLEKESIEREEFEKIFGEEKMEKIIKN